MGATYRLDAAAVTTTLRRRALVKAGFVLVALAVATPFVTFRRGDGDWADTMHVGMLSVAIISVVAFFSLWTSSSRERRWLMTYTLRIGDDVLSREQEHAVTLRIGRSEITRIVEGSGGLAVMTSSPERCIGIPRTLERYVEARETLTAWCSIEPADKARWTPTIVLIAIMFVSAASAVSPGPWAIVTTIILWAMVAYSVWTIRRAEDVRRDHKNVATVFLLWLALTPIGRVGFPLLNALLEKLAAWH